MSKLHLLSVPKVALPLRRFVTICNFKSSAPFRELSLTTGTTVRFEAKPESYILTDGSVSCMSYFQHCLHWYLIHSFYSGSICNKSYLAYIPTLRKVKQIKLVHICSYSLHFQKQYSRQTLTNSKINIFCR